MTISMHTVQSTSIAALGYRRRTMNVQFSTGRTYEFKKVPRAIFDQFSNAVSKGVFFNQVIKEMYPCHELM